MHGLHRSRKTSFFVIALVVKLVERPEIFRRNGWFGGSGNVGSPDLVAIR